MKKFDQKDDTLDVAKTIKTLNARISRTQQYIKEKNLDTTLYDSIIKDIKKIEGVSLTDSDRISLKKEEIAKLTPEAIKTLLSTVLTPKAFIELSESIIAEQAEDMDIDTDSMSDREKVALAGAIIKIYDSYSDALEEFYTMREVDTSAIVDDEIRAEIEKAIIDIGRAIRHPGVWTLPVSNIDQNKKLIGELSGKLDALKGGA